MNKARLRKLAQRLDKTPREKFDMDNYCGTAVCVGGHARLLARKPWPYTFGPARSYLDLDERTAINLMEPRGYKAYHATPKQAAKVIRHLIKTGKVEWEKFV